MTPVRCIALVVCILAASCGIEDYPYLEPVPIGSITIELNSRSTVLLPKESPGRGFIHFTVFYRIYVSTVPESGSIGTGVMSTLNSTMLSDYNTLLPYTDTTNTTTTTAVGTLFKNRRFYELELDGIDIDRNVLNSSSIGKTLIFNFPQIPGEIPTLTVGTANPYQLQRTSGDGTFTPEPTDRYFQNSTELNSSKNAVTTINADVAGSNEANESVTRYTYVMLYIVATGIDSNFAPVYSSPAFVGVLRLPDPEVQP
ncbi:hypothetical protein FACS1894172_02350 [Spirochaetia bacterium]|nr:hypothetical protein FACS1894172_02350 [Spirochaetia bacterium]